MLGAMTEVYGSQRGPGRLAGEGEDGTNGRTDEGGGGGSKTEPEQSSVRGRCCGWTPGGWSPDSCKTREVIRGPEAKLNTLVF